MSLPGNEIERMHGSTDFLLRLLFETYKKKWWSGDSIIRIQMDESVGVYS